MSPRVTRECLQVALNTLAFEMNVAGFEGKLYLETWSPGDYLGTRYRVETADGCEPVLSHYVFGAGAALDMLSAAIGVLRTVRYAREQASRKAE